MITYIEALHKYKKLNKCYFCNIKAEKKFEYNGIVFEYDGCDLIVKKLKGKK